MTIATHLAVTPARNEAENLTRLAASLREQSWRPTMWIVVDNGSTDDTREVVGQLAEEFDWIRLLAIGSHDNPVRGSASVRAFNLGVQDAPLQADLISNVDADVSFETNYFEKVREAFDGDEALGIAAGTCLERDGERWKPVHVTSPNLRGAALTFRRECLAELSPLEGRMGWDGISTVRACLRGWKTAQLADIAYYHHRNTGARDKSRFSSWASEGDSSYYMWYRPSYLFLRSLFLMATIPDPSAGGLVWGYARSAARRAPRHSEPGFRDFMREQQGIRSLGERRREALGQRASSGT
jgi:glycosyltransferase involved in cell wall biosynthesis